MRYLIKLAYKGTAYHGWQKQQNAHSVQQELEEKLAMLLGKPTDTLGCGRTDTGVHAREFYAHFDSENELDTNKLCYQLNHVTPEDMVFYHIQTVADHFNARFDAAWREYEYTISTEPNPFLLDFSWQYFRPLNIEAMNKACQILMEYEDFECFSKVNTQVTHFICHLMKAQWEQKDNTLVFTVRANRFLRNMVRAMVGTLVEAGLEKLDEPALRKILDSKERSEAGQSVPSKGLCLTKVFYPGLQNIESIKHG